MLAIEPYRQAIWTRGAVMIGRLQQQLPAMFALAHERNDGARVQLAGMLADVFLADDTQLSSREEQLVNELIDQLLQTRSAAVRRALVEKFADSARIPRKMAMRLACDDIDVAQSILLSNILLTDSDLVTVVETQSHEHAKAIAARQSVNEAVADALIVTGDAEIMQIVVENLGAQLSPKAIDVLTESAHFTVALRDPLVHRPEMTVDAATQLYWWVSQDLRRYMLKRFGIAAGQIDEALAKTIDALLGDHELEKNNDEIMLQVTDWLAERDVVSVRILPQVLRLGHFRLFNILLGRLTGLDLPTVDLAVTGAGGRALAVICRALGVDKPGFVSIFLLSRGARVGEQIVHPRELSHALLAFDRLSVRMAQDLLNSWRKDPSYLRQKQDDLAYEE
jgi:uncharacterized protein (DUF2336 family)